MDKERKSKQRKDLHSAVGGILDWFKVEGIEETGTLDVLRDFVGLGIGGGDIAERNGLDASKKRKDSESQREVAVHCEKIDRDPAQRDKVQWE